MRIEYLPLNDAKNEIRLILLKAGTGRLAREANTT
jgi:hypothetical protein